MTDDAAIQRLQTVPPTVRRRTWARWLSPVTAAISAAAITVALLSNQHAGNVGECVNTNLATRNDPAAREVDAQIGKAQADLKALQQITVSPAAGLAAYTDSTRQYIVTLQAVKAERDAHPLGKC